MKAWKALLPTTAALALGIAVISPADAGSTTYPVTIAANGGVGACQSSTGGLTNVTYNPGSSSVTIQCASPNGFAWGRNLDTPSTASGAIDDTVGDVSLSWSANGTNNSGGRALGLLLKVPNMGVKSTGLSFVDPEDSTTPTEFTNTPAGRQAQLNLKMSRIPWIASGTVTCVSTDAEVGVVLADDGYAGKSGQFKKYKANIKVRCGSQGPAGQNGKDANAGVFKSVGPMSMDAGSSPKTMTLSQACDTGSNAVAGGYDLTGSTTSQWPTIVYNGPDNVDATTGKASGWRVVIGVPSQTSSAAKALLKVWVSCSVVA